MHHFPSHLIFTHRTLQLISIVENDTFYTTVKLINMPFNKDHILTKKDTLHKSCQKNFQVSILISEAFRSC